jgi:hypothetical protein
VTKQSRAARSNSNRIPQVGESEKKKILFHQPCKAISALPVGRIPKSLPHVVPIKYIGESSLHRYNL